MTELPKSSKSVFSEWLEKLQQESWQLELLISGLALFGIWESRSTILKLEYYLDANITSTYSGYGNSLVTLFWAGWIIFMANLLIHIILRGLWIGAIGLRYVSGDIDFDTLNYSEVFRRHFKNKIGSFDEYIERLEKLSSVIFSFTFLLFSMMLSFVFLNFVFAFVATIINNVFYEGSDTIPTATFIFGGLFYGIGFLVLIDFITLGGFKKVKDPTFSKIYFWIYRFFSFISLSWTYRPLLLNFIDNKYTKKLFFLALPYTLVLLVGLVNLSFERHSFIPSFDSNDEYSEYIDKNSINWNNYDDLRAEYHNTFSDEERSEYRSRISIASLNKHEISDDYAKLFLVYHRNDSKLLERQNEDFSVFQESGLRHSLFSNGKVEDPIIEELKSKQLREIKLMLKAVRGQETEIDSSERAEFGELIDDYKNHSTDNIPELRENIRSIYSKQREEHASKKYRKGIDLILHNYKIDVDDILYKDSLECSYFTHPNIHEKGLMCYFPTESLNKGSHMIKIIKTYNRDECLDDCPTWTKYIPFRKL